MSDEGRLVAGRYRLERRIGAGAMGVVWLAHDERLGRQVAVKKLLLQPGLPPAEAEEAVARCMREGRIAARLHHPNAIAVFDVVDEDGAPCLVMEYLPSVSLAIALGEDGALPPREVARIGAHVAAALAAAHAAGIVHRDIKPGNILLGDDGSVKITDFGISRATDDVTVTKTGLIAGTPAYLSPEVAIGREPAATSDVYSLGSTLYAAVEGEPPYGLSENTLGLLHAVASGKINPPQRAGPLSALLVALLAAEPADRPTAAKARDMLAAVSRGDRADVPPPPPPPVEEATRVVGPAAASTAVRRQTRPAVAPPPVKSAKPLVFASAAVAAIIAVGAWILVDRQGRADQETEQPQSPPTLTSQSVTSAPSTPVSTQPSAEPEPTTTEKVQVTTTTTTSAAPEPTSAPPPAPTSSSQPTGGTTTTTTTTQPSESQTANG